MLLRSHGCGSSHLRASYNFKFERSNADYMRFSPRLVLPSASVMSAIWGQRNSGNKKLQKSYKALGIGNNGRPRNWRFRLAGLQPQLSKQNLRGVCTIIRWAFFIQLLGPIKCTWSVSSVSLFNNRIFLS